MQPEPEYLRQHYALLSDEALLAVDRADLVEMARVIFDQEVGSRNLVLSQDNKEPDPPDKDADDDEAEDAGQTYDTGEEPDWLEDAAEVHGYAAQSATAPAPDAGLEARDALESAGIPCWLDLSEMPPEKSLYPYGTHRWRLMVPGQLNLQATSVLQRDIFNDDFESGWKTHLETLSDEELQAMNPQVALCGLFDRIARVNRVYAEEVARRRLKQK